MFGNMIEMYEEQFHHHMEKFCDPGVVVQGSRSVRRERIVASSGDCRRSAGGSVAFDALRLCPSPRGGGMHPCCPKRSNVADLP